MPTEPCYTYSILSDTGNVETVQVNWPMTVDPEPETPMIDAMESRYDDQMSTFEHNLQRIREENAAAQAERAARGSRRLRNTPVYNPTVVEPAIRIGPVLNDMLDKLVYVSEVARYMHYSRVALSTKRGNYFEYEHGTITYLPDNREHRVYSDGRFHPQGRQAMKIGRFVKAVLPQGTPIEDYAVEDFVNKMRGLDYSTSADFQIVEGQDITKYYGEDYNVSGQGSLASSCMRHDMCHGYFGVYTDNPDLVKMLVLMDTERDAIYGRALVWYLPGYDRPIMDRVYGTQATQEAFKTFAVECGWIYRTYNTYSHPTSFVVDGEETTVELYLPIAGMAKYRRLPYFDTLKYYYANWGVVSNVPLTHCRTHHGVARQVWPQELTDIRGNRDVVHSMTIDDIVEDVEDLQAIRFKGPYNNPDPIPVPRWNSVQSDYADDDWDLVSEDDDPEV